jgi:hypothetical protein
MYLNEDAEIIGAVLRRQLVYAVGVRYIVPLVEGKSGVPPYYT